MNCEYRTNSLPAFSNLLWAILIHQRYCYTRMFREEETRLWLRFYLVDRSVCHFRFSTYP